MLVPTQTEALALAGLERMLRSLSMIERSRGKPLPRTIVESMSMLAFARQQGVVAFWGASPNTDAGDVHMHWPTEDSSTLIYRKGENRCILIASGLGPMKAKPLSPPVRRFAARSLKLSCTSSSS